MQATAIFNVESKTNPLTMAENVSGWSDKTRPSQPEKSGLMTKLTQVRRKVTTGLLGGIFATALSFGTA